MTTPKALADSLGLPPVDVDALARTSLSQHVRSCGCPFTVNDYTVEAFRRGYNAGYQQGIDDAERIALAAVDRAAR